MSGDATLSTENARKSVLGGPAIALDTSATRELPQAPYPRILSPLSAPKASSFCLWALHCMQDDLRGNNVAMAVAPSMPT